MRHNLTCAAIGLACGLIAAPSAAQSLGDLARQEEARRATSTRKAVKSFSNADLAPTEIADTAPKAAAVPAAVSEPCDPTVNKDKCVSSDQAAVKAAGEGEAQTQSDAPKLVEAEWRRNAEDLRRQLAKARADYEKVAVSANDQSRQPGDRAAAERVAAQHEKFIGRLERSWERFEQQATELGVPAQWIEPKPTLSPRTPQ